MKNTNICKIVPPSLAAELSVSCFVLESDAAVMGQKTSLVAHRMMLVKQGTGVFHISEKKISFSAGTLLIGFQGETFSVEGEGVEFFYIHFGGGRAEELFRRFGISAEWRSFGGLDGLISLWSESLSRASEETVDLAAESILLYTFSRLFGKGSPQRGVVEQMISIAEDQFADPMLSLGKVAQLLAYNPKYLSHLFKEKMGRSYSEYLRELRIRYAIALFDRGICSVKNVALLSGFTDPLYFSAVFKRCVGLSPTVYKKEKNVGGQSEENT